MNTPKLAIAMNYIDENLISGAIDYKPTIPSKKVTLFKKHSCCSLPLRHCYGSNLHASK